MPAIRKGPNYYWLDDINLLLKHQEKSFKKAAKYGVTFCEATTRKKVIL